MDFNNIINNDKTEELKVCFTNENKYNQLMEYINSLGINENSLSLKNLEKIALDDDIFQIENLDNLKEEIKNNIFNESETVSAIGLISLVNKNISNLNLNYELLTQFLKNIIKCLQYFFNEGVENDVLIKGLKNQYTDITNIPYFTKHKLRFQNNTTIELKIGNEPQNILLSIYTLAPPISFFILYNTCHIMLKKKFYLKD